MTQMHEFFQADPANLKLDETDFITEKRMEWFDVEIDRVYWRQCYSYILCSTIAFFEKTRSDYRNTPAGNQREKRGMVLTGVQGSGGQSLVPSLL